MTILASLRGRRLAPGLLQEAAVYRLSGEAVSAFQLARFNASWAESLQRSPWARELRRQRDLPAHFESWDAFQQLIPVQRKADLRDVVTAAPGVDADVTWRATGGTTAEPLRFPVFGSEAAAAQRDMWLGRGRFGVTPADRLFMIWGHAHLFGSGLKGAVARVRRQLSDLALGYTRWSAYHLSPDDLRRAGDALLSSRARYVIGYSSALDRFARANADRAADFARLGLAVVIATAEGFPLEDSREAISACFGCPTVMEYGSVETGPVAYERAAGGYDAFWASYRLEVAHAAVGDAGQELVVTSLYPRALPLLRYAIGDLVVAADLAAPLTGFEAVRGRCNDVIVMPDGAVIHSEAFTHAVRDAPSVRAFQVVRRPGQAPLIRYEADRALPGTAQNVVRDRLGKVHASLAGIVLEHVMELPRSIAGKHRMVVESD